MRAISLQRRRCRAIATVARRVIGAALLLAALLVRPAFLNAHHEAIFGPQSSLVLSADKFVSVQVFSREAGISTSRAGKPRDW